MSARTLLRRAATVSPPPRDEKSLLSVKRVRRLHQMNHGRHRCCVRSTSRCLRERRDLQAGMAWPKATSRRCSHSDPEETLEVTAGRLTATQDEFKAGATTFAVRVGADPCRIVHRSPGQLRR